MRLILVRHGPTEWNRTRRMQGRHDLPLDDDGRKWVSGLRPDPDWRKLEWCTSPLQRAVETARLLGQPGPVIEPLLVEMDWGQFEGRTLDELRTELGETMTAMENDGLDFRPPQGESPRDVLKRFDKLVARLERDPADRVLVTHKGVRRAAIVWATGWNMLGKPPIRLADDEALLLDIDGTGERPPVAGKVLMR